MQTKQTEGIQRSAELYAMGQSKEAYETISRLFRAQPDSEDVNFALGMTAFGIGKLSHAVLAFERVISLNPDNDRARLELARAYAAMGQFELAEVYFDEVLDKSPPLQVRKNIEKFLDQLHDAKKKGRVSVHAATGVFYDDNVNVGSKADRIRIARTLFGLVELDELTLDDDALPKESFGAYLMVALQGTYDPGFRGQWVLTGGVNHYTSWLEQHHEYEIDFLRGYVGMRHSGRYHLFDARARAEHLWRDGDSLISIAGFTPLLLYALTPDVRLDSKLNVEYRDYSGSDDLDAVYMELGETVNFLLPGGGHTVSLFGAGLYNDAEAGAFDYAGYEAGVGVDLRLPFETALIGTASWRYSKYGAKQPLETERREDGEFAASVSFNRKIAPEWNGSLSLQHTQNHSTFDLYDFERNIITLSADHAF